MNARIRQLGKHENNCAHKIDNGLVGSRGEGGGRVHGVGAEETRKDPVEGAVFEDVAGRHGAGGELMHEEGFELALDEVRDEHGEGEPLGVGEGRGRGDAFVEVGTGEDDGYVEEDGAEVFEEEDGLPGDLGA